MDTVLQDVRYAFRSLRRTPTFTIVAVLTLALGIGANTALFSVVNSVLLRPLPYRDPERIVLIWNSWTGWPRTWLSEPELADYARERDTFERVAAFDYRSVNLTGGDRPERIRGGLAQAGLFAALGVEPLLGRTFLPDEDRPGGTRVVLLGHDLWRRRFAADPHVVGTSIVLDGERYTVTGVMPPGFRYPLDFAGAVPELWLPLALGTPDEENRGSHYLNAVARLAPGVTLQQAQARMTTLARRLAREHANYDASFGITLVPVTEQVLGDIRPALFVLLGAVSLVLLIACANVANLLLSRAEARQKEMAIRTALGAGRGRLARQLLTESALLGVLGGAVGLLLALWGIDVLPAVNPASVPRAGEIGVDGRALAFTLVVSLATAALFGLAPAVQASRGDVGEALKEGGRGITAGSPRQRFRRALVVSEVTLAVVLVIGAGLMARSFLTLRAVRPGFDAANVLTMRLSLPMAKYRDDPRITGFYAELLERIRALPGVQSAGAIAALPLSTTIGDWSFIIEGRPVPGPHEASPAADWQVSDAEYFRAMGIPLLRGRFFTAADRKGASGVVIINETTARRYWPGESALGQRIRLGGTVDSVWRTVVGVVGDVHHRGLHDDVRSELYLPHAQFPGTTPDSAGGAQRSMSLVVRTAGDPLRMSDDVQRVIRAMDADLPVSDVRSLEQVLSASVSKPRFSLLLLGIFAVVALVLAAVGIYGIVSYSVTRRTHEIGIRIALGAGRAEVLRMAVGQGMLPALTGVAFGLVGAFATTRLMASLLYGVSATDPLTFLLIALVLTVVSLTASYIPARRATRVNPMVALRYE